MGQTLSLLPSVLGLSTLHSPPRGKYFILTLQTGTEAQKGCPLTALQSALPCPASNPKHQPLFKISKEKKKRKKLVRQMGLLHLSQQGQLEESQGLQAFTYSPECLAKTQCSLGEACLGFFSISPQNPHAGSKSCWTGLL